MEAKPWRRITTACSGRTRVSRPVLEERTGRATRRAADAGPDRLMDSKKASIAYPVLERKVVDILVAHDPSGLYALGAPRDEHDRDVHAIISRLQHASGPADVEGILADVLRPWLEDAGKSTTEFCAVMAPGIWEAWQNFRKAAG